MTMLFVIVGFMLLFVTLPMVAYMIMKFGAAGYFRAKRRDNQNQKNPWSDSSDQDKQKEKHE